jgi:ATP-dependent DNA helicase RecG
MAHDQLAFDFNPPAADLLQLWTPDDIYTNCSQDTITRFSEDRRVERKRVEVSQKTFADYLSMWSNTQPYGGVLFIGVDKQGVLLGCKHSETSHLNDFETARRLCPDARYEMKRVPITDSKGEDNFIIVVRVRYRSDKLVETVEGNAYVREGDERRLLSEAEKREIRLNKGELDAETERVPLLFPEDFDIGLMNQFRQAYVSKRNLPSRYSVEDVLQLCQLGKQTNAGFEPNLACAIIFAKNARTILPGAFIRVVRYEGMEEHFGQRMNAVADQFFDGPLPLQIAKAETFIESQVRNFTRLGRDARFKTSPEYPKDVWLEAVVNAAVHRSYNLKNMNIFVKMFEDKMVIESPGTFFPPTTANTVYDAHNPRNPNLMWAMYYFDFVQCAYEGTRRMRAGMQEANLPEPIFEQREAGVFQVSVVLQNDVEHRKKFVREEAMPAIDPAIYGTLTQEEKILTNWAAEGKEMTVKDAQDVLGLSDWRKARAVLDSLTNKFVLQRPPGKDRDRHRPWSIRKSRLPKPTHASRG